MTEMRWAVNIVKRMSITVSDIQQGRNTTYTLDVVISCSHRLTPGGHIAWTTTTQICDRAEWCDLPLFKAATRAPAGLAAMVKLSAYRGAVPSRYFFYGRVKRSAGNYAWFLDQSRPGIINRSD